MSNDLSTIDFAKFQVGLANMAKGTSRLGFLKMDKTGAWSFGQDEVPVGPEDKVYVDPMGFVHGWQCWANTDIPGVDAKMLDEKIVPMFEPLPEKPFQTPENGRPWSELRGMSVALNGQALKYSTTSVGGLNAIASLAEKYAKQFVKDRSKLVAVLSLTCDSYKHPNKTYGKIFTPVLNVVDWVSAVPTTEVAEVTPVAEPVKAVKAAPKKTTAKAARKAV